MTIFGQSARYYDSLYADKNYAAEVDYVSGLVRRHTPGARTILDLGCGTGRHAIEFAERGYTVLGVDRSSEMLQRAQQQHTCLSAPVLERLAFAQYDLRSLRLERRFDCVVALFHVLSYQSSNDDVLAAFATAKSHLKPGGALIFDCWYGPGVLTDPPVVRTRAIEERGQRLTRIAEPVMRVNANLVAVRYRFIVEMDLPGPRAEFEETHTMRYFFAPELALALQMTGLRLVALYEWMTAREPNCHTWNVSVVAQSGA
jgi:SAM-dependent methyltransferase